MFDPPYMHTPGGTAHVNHQNFEGYYRNNRASSASKYHEAVLDLYFAAAKEAVARFEAERRLLSSSAKTRYAPISSG